MRIGAVDASLLDLGYLPTGSDEFAGQFVDQKTDAFRYTSRRKFGKLVENPQGNLTIIQDE